MRWTKEVNAKPPGLTTAPTRVSVDTHSCQHTGDFLIPSGHFQMPNETIVCPLLNNDSFSLGFFLFNFCTLKCPEIHCRREEVPQEAAERKGDPICSLQPACPRADCRTHTSVWNHGNAVR